MDHRPQKEGVFDRGLQIFGPPPALAKSEPSETSSENAGYQRKWPFLRETVQRMGHLPQFSPPEFFLWHQRQMRVTVHDMGRYPQLCWRDSFGIALYPYLAETFHDAVFSRSATYDLVRLKAELIYSKSIF